jgi:hypothetical protein
VICVALSSALVTGAFALAQTAAPEPAPTKLSLPTAMAMSERQLFELLIPEFDRKLEAYTDASRTDLDRAESWFSPKITSVLETDLGYARRRFVLVSVNSTVGMCGQCGSTELAILEVPTSRILWRQHYDGHGGATFDKLFFAAPGVPVLTAIENEGSEGGFGGTYGVWLRPALEADGTITCRVLWRDFVESSNGGNRAGGRFSACAQMTRREQPGEYQYEQRTFYGEDSNDYTHQIILEENAAPVTTAVERLACTSCPYACGCGAVEIRRTERWTLSKDGREMKRSSFSAVRIDHDTSEVFPFNLPQREVPWSLSNLTAPVSRLEGEDRAVTSPAGRFVARTSHAGSRGSLLLERSHGAPIRSIPFWLGDYFDGHPFAIGWSEDESRVLAVVEFGLDDRVLLSFSVTGADDYWEKLLTADQEVWKDGFVLAEPVKPH